ncbi:hypothetical protein CRUP_037265 [Coryphaenoides rupestris]|nr:hypothetical protein CRUP_037265 [Coryphaenoides rupestris]
MQLEAGLLYQRGIVEHSLRSYGLVERQAVARTFVDCIQTTMTHGHNLQVLHQCYLEVGFLFLQDWQNIPSKTLGTSSPHKGSYWRTLVASLRSRLVAAEEHLLPFWVCLRAACTVMSSMRSTAQPGGSTAADEEEEGRAGGGGGGGVLSSQELNTLPAFAWSDLCGARDAGTHRSSADEHSSTQHTQPLTWTHLARYYTHLLNLQHAASTEQSFERPWTPGGRGGGGGGVQVVHLPQTSALCAVVPALPQPQACQPGYALTDIRSSVAKDASLRITSLPSQNLQQSPPPPDKDNTMRVPFEVSVENVRYLERCFDPSGGAILESSLLTEWILAALINS